MIPRFGRARSRAVTRTLSSFTSACDAELARMLRAADQFPAGSRRAEQLNASILAAAAPLLDERAAPQRTLWDYADRWASMLLPIGALTAIAAGVCLFVLASHPAASNGMPPVRVALLGAATNRMSSQSLVDFLVTGDAGLPPLGRRVR